MKLNLVQVTALNRCVKVLKKRTMSKNKNTCKCRFMTSVKNNIIRDSLSKDKIAGHEVFSVWRSKTVIWIYVCLSQIVQVKRVLYTSGT